VLRAFAFGLALVLAATAPALAAGAVAFPVLDTSGRPLGNVAIESTDLDRVSSSLAPDGKTAAVVVEHGRYGGATLYMVGNGGSRSVLDVRAPESLSQVEWSPGGRRFALVRSSASTWIAGNPPRLQEHGSLVLGSRGGALASIGGPDDAARVLGWLGPDEIVFTRYLPGDLPEERPWLLVLPSGALRPLTDGRTAHAYSFTLIDGRLYFSRTDRTVVTAPDDAELVALVERALASGEERVLATEKGALPVEMKRIPGGLTWQLDGMYVARSLELRTGRITTKKLEPPGRPAVLRSPHPGGDLAMPWQSLCPAVSQSKRHGPEYCNE
jgi:dipeptidyl aminopeptidase/acylaminoacyl peptidase